MQNKDPLRNFRFEVDIDGVTNGGFQKVSGINVEVASIEYREGTDSPRPRKLTGRDSYEDVTLERGAIAGNSDLWDAMCDSISSKDEGHGKTDSIGEGTDGYISDMTITAKDRLGNKAKEWELHNAFVTKYTLGEMEADANDILVETLQVTYEYLTVNSYNTEGGLIDNIEPNT